MAEQSFPITVQLLERQLVVYRGCRGTSAKALTDAMRSNYELGRKPHPADLRATVLHMAVSMFEDGDRLRRLALHLPERIGTHIARLELPAGQGICFADTGSIGHWSVWGRPGVLKNAIVELTPIAE